MFTNLFTILSVCLQVKRSSNRLLTPKVVTQGDGAPIAYSPVISPPIIKEIGQ